MLYDNTSTQKTESLSVQAILSLIANKTGYQPKRSGSGYLARCPAHDDQNPSLQISEGTDGTILLCCHAGCSYINICDSIGIETKCLFPQSIEKIPQVSAEKKPQKTATYPYRNKDGKLICWKERFEPGFNGNEKSFVWKRKSEKGEIIKDRKGCEKVLFNMPEILTAIEMNKPIFLVEGEKDVHTLFKCGLIASTASESTEWNDEFTNTLKDAHVNLLYDNDRAGLKRKYLIIKNLAGKVKSLRVIDLPGIEYRESHGEDITDWLNKGNTIEQLLELVKNTPEYTPTPEQEPHQSINGLRAVSIEELFALKLPPREMLLSPFLPSQGLVLIAAKRGVGKTHIALGIAYAVATGETFLCWHAPTAKRVLYIDGEMPASLMQERLEKIIMMNNNKRPEGDFFKLITPDLQDIVMPDLSTKQGRDAIEPFIRDCDLVVLDNISCLFRSGGENESESWQEAQEWALDIRRRGKSVLFVHHAGKSGNQRGTSKKEDILDTVITLKQPDDYQPEQGARFEVKFDKSRHFSGEDARSFQVQLIGENGMYQWEISNDPEEVLLAKIADMRANGYTIQAIIEKTSKSKSQVETLIKKAKNKGL